MTLFETLEMALASDLLSREMTQLPARGATPLELEALEAAVRRPMSEQHRRLLSRWNGADLDIIRVYGAGAVESGIYPIESEAHWAERLGLTGAIIVGSDYSGFLYFELADGSIYQWDHDGDENGVVGSDLEDFLQNRVFGERSRDHYGAEWLAELQRAGLVAGA